MTREEQQMEKRFLDLGRMAYQRGIVTYTDFLNLNEQNILYGTNPLLKIGMKRFPWATEK